MAAAASLLVIALAAGWGTPPMPPQAMRGFALYERLCLTCHGATGDGHGPAARYVWPAPRAFTRGDFKWRSTAVGGPPTEDDVRATIALGAPGTAMPGFAALTPAQLDDVLAVVRGFAPAAWDGAARAVELGAPPPPDRDRGAALWRDKGCPACHGILADGHGPSSFALRAPPYDLRVVLHRPREIGVDAYREAAAHSIATGLAGTAMPSFAGTLPDADIWALADHIVAIAGTAGAARPASDASADPDRRDDRALMPALMPALIDADRKAPIQTGTWPGTGDTDEVAVFGAAVAPQGPPPAALAPAEASLHARQCARCHAKQAREWQASMHAAAASPGLVAQTEYGMAADERAGCLRCHAPLAEQASDAALRGEGVTCAGCHVRGWVRRGPPEIAPSLLTLPGYPLITTGLYERADFCLPCHQLPPRSAVVGRPLLDTYREWLAGPYMPRGVQCQHCHMANREHSVLGIHDPATFRQGIELGATVARHGGIVTAVATLRNIGAGHALPTTPTPAVWLAITLLDARGQPIEGASDRRRIGRDVWFDGTWHERADTRIAPGATASLTRGWAGGRIADAATLRVTVEVHPDAYYEQFYADRLAGPLAPAQRALYQQAAARARGSHYVAEQRDVPLAR